MVDSSSIVTSLNTARDELKADLEKQVRRLEMMAEVSDRLAVVQHKFYESYRKAGFDDYDARVMAQEIKPFIVT